MQPWLFYDEEYIQNKQSLKRTNYDTITNTSYLYLNLTSLHSPMVINQMNVTSISGVFKCLFDWYEIIAGINVKVFFV